MSRRDRPTGHDGIMHSSGATEPEAPRVTDAAKPKPKRRYGTIVKHLRDDPETAVELAAKLDDDVLGHLTAALRQEAENRARNSGDHDAIIEAAFESGFGRDGLGVNPWIENNLIVCPGAIVNKNRTNHICRFVSVNGTWIWEAIELIREDKRSAPGKEGGFRAVALLPVVGGLAFDVVKGRARSGSHTVEHVTSFKVSRRKLVEVSQRDVKPSGMY